MPFSAIDTAAVGRALSQIADQPGDLCDVFFERIEDLELTAGRGSPGLLVRREAGLAVRLVRGERSWLAARDELSSAAFDDALRRAERALPRASYPRPEIAGGAWPDPPRAPELLELPSRLRHALGEHGASLTDAATVRRHRRSVLVAGTRLTAGVEQEAFYSLELETPWGPFGTLLADLSTLTVDRLAHDLVRALEARDGAPPQAGARALVLGPAATAVTLHEAVAHALEADTLALAGHPEAALGLRLGSAGLHVLDDPSAAPDGVRRATDDEGFPVLRRWLLRDGVVEQPLCDRGGSRDSETLAPGAARRGSRHLPPAPRSNHLELLPGELTHDDLLADAAGGLYLPEVSRGHLEPLTGRFTIRFPYGWRIEAAGLGEPVGPCTLKGHLTDLLSAVRGIGRETRVAGAGWCAKDGVKLPVWATAPELRLEGLEIS